MKKLRPLLTFLLVLAVLVVAYFASLYLANKAKEKEMSEQRQANVNTNANTATTPSNAANTKSYINSDHKFSFQYPADFKTGVEDFTYLPYNNQARAKTEANFYHEIDEDHCSMSGECEATTRDLDIGVAIMNESLQSIRGKVIEPLTEVAYGSTNAYTIRQGVEGEGIIYTFIPLTSKTTLLIYNTYIDESMLLNYQKAEGFISYARQGQIMESLFRSLKITN